MKRMIDPWPHPVDLEQARSCLQRVFVLVDVTENGPAKSWVGDILQALDEGVEDLRKENPNVSFEVSRIATTDCCPERADVQVEDGFPLALEILGARLASRIDGDRVKHKKILRPVVALITNRAGNGQLALPFFSIRRANELFVNCDRVVIAHPSVGVQGLDYRSFVATDETVYRVSDVVDVVGNVVRECLVLDDFLPEEVGRASTSACDYLSPNDDDTPLMGGDGPNPIPPVMDIYEYDPPL